MSARVLSLDLDVTYLIVLALFVLPLLVLNGLVFGPFLKVFEERHEQLVGSVDRADKTLKEAEKKAKTFDEKIKGATANGMEARNAIRTHAAAATAKRIEEERLKLAGKLQSSLDEIGGLRTRALAEVEAVSKAMARQTASKLLGREI